jgi:hypothetical protein
MGTVFWNAWRCTLVAFLSQVKLSLHLDSPESLLCTCDKRTGKKLPRSVNALSTQQVCAGRGYRKMAGNFASSTPLCRSNPQICSSS